MTTIIYTNTSGTIITTGANEGNLSIAPGDSVTLTSFNSALDLAVIASNASRTVDGVIDNNVGNDASLVSQQLTSQISAAPTASALDGSELVPVVQVGTASKGTLTSIANWMLKTFSGFLPEGTGAIATTIQEALRWRVTVKGFGATGDGVTSDQAGVAAAVAYCYSTGKWLYWPVGTYLTTASIPNFQDVHHYGPGIVKRGSGLFYVTPIAGALNNLYVATTGSDTNDGLSASQPRLTVQSMGNCIYNYAYGNSNWVVNLAAGTYIEAATFSNAFPTPNRVKFLGATVARGVQPTTIMQCPSKSVGVSSAGIYFQNNIRAQVSNINFKGYQTNASPDYNEISAGIVADARCELYTDNVWSDDCDQGIFGSNGTQLRIQAGRHGFNAVNGAGVQFGRHSHGIVGYAGTLSDITGATGTAFIGGSAGVLLSEFAMAHTDTCYFKSQTSSGVQANYVSRVHSVSSTYDSCLVGIDARMNSIVGDTTNTFINCGTDTTIHSGSRNASIAWTEAVTDGPPVKEVNVVGGATTSASPVALYTKAFGAKELARRGAGFKLKIYGEAIGSAGTKTFTFTLGATTLKAYTIAATTTDFELNVELFNVTAATSQKCMTRKIENGVLGVTDLNVSIAEDLTAAKTLTVTYQANAGDTLRVGIIDLEIQH